MKKRQQWWKSILAMLLAVILVIQPGMSALADVTSVLQQQEEATEEEVEFVATFSNAIEIEGKPEAYSLLPLETIEAYLVLPEFEFGQSSDLTLETLLSLLTDENGRSLNIPTYSNAVWNGLPDMENDADNYQVLHSGDIINFDVGLGTYYEFELIVGSGDQLDPNRIRYIVHVVDNSIEEEFSYSFYSKAGTDVHKLSEDGVASDAIRWLEDENVPITSVTYMSSDYVPGETYYFSVHSPLAASVLKEKIDLKIYPMKEFLEYHVSGLELDGDITDSILNLSETDIENGAGCDGTFAVPEDENADNVFCFVYTDRNSGQILGYHGFSITLAPMIDPISGDLYSFEDNQMEKVASFEYAYEDDQFSWLIYMLPELGIEARYIDEFIWADYSVECDGSEELYLVLDEHSSVKHVVVVEDLHEHWIDRYLTYKEDMIDLPSNMIDITDVIFPANRNEKPYGHNAIFGWHHNQYGPHVITEGSTYSLLMDNNSLIRICIYADGGDPEFDGKISGRMDLAPINHGEDPYFQITGASGIRDIYIPKNKEDRTIDTLYGYGYQTAFILDNTVDLAKLKPTFKVPAGYKVHSGSVQTSGVNVQDFTDGPVYYTVHDNDQHKNYNVTFLKQANGPKLFVNGPDERNIFLDEYHENCHDILIANIGDAELTGLNVELVGAQNIKLDEYWSIGGLNNDTLGAFDSVEVHRNDAGGWDEQGELANIAKIRILPDGEGEVRGTLRISADRQETVEIVLTGYAGNPDIITEDLDEAVKYVPYSYMVSTNNMHTWNKVKYVLDDTVGKLPKGLSLNSDTGEIYGVPLESGEFEIAVEAVYSKEEFYSSWRPFTLIVNENTNENVYAASDDGYEVKTYIGTETSAGSNDYVVNEFKDYVFTSYGEYNEFVDLWLNGEKLEVEKEYDKESGSTILTIRSQTFRKKTVLGSNTIAAEFRVDGDKTKALKRTAQNFRMTIVDDGKEDENQNNTGNTGGTEDTGNRGESNDGGTKKGNGSSFGGGSATAPQEGWIQDAVGWWYRNADGTWPASTWMYLPYNDTMEWYYFNEQGYMMTGWLLDNGRWYYLHEVSDGMKGRMDTGWNLIDGKWYYMNEISDGTKGAMMASTWIGKYYVDENGVWQ